MHTIKLKRLVFSNILSYGNNENEVLFIDGLTWIKGPNGAGKSTIIEALTFAFFGKPYRAINKEHLRNTANKSKLSVLVEFERIDSKGTAEYLVEREMGASGTGAFKITKNGETEKKGAGITQKKLEDEVLGFNLILWENILSLNTIQTTPFIDMAPDEKRKLLESILTMQLDKLKDLNKKQLKEVNVKFDTATSDVVKYQKDVIEFDGLIIQMQQEVENDIESLQLQVASCQDSIQLKNVEKNNIQKEIKTITKQGIDKKVVIDAYGDIDLELTRYNGYKILLTDIQQLTDELKEIETRKFASVEVVSEWEKKCESISDSYALMLPEYEDNLRNHERKLNSLENDKKNYEKRLVDIKVEADSLKEGIPCPTCGKESCESDFKDKKEQLRKEWKEINTELKKCNTLIAEQTKVVQVVKTETNEYKSTVEANTALLNEKRIAVMNCFSISEEYKKTSTKFNVKKSQMTESITLEEVDLKKIELALQKTQYNVDVSELNTLRQTLATKQQEIKGIDALIKNYEDSIIEHESKIAQKKEENSENSIAIAIAKLEGAKLDAERAINRVQKYSDEIAITQYIEKMYADNGVKKIILGMFVPNLNKAVAHNFTLFNLPFTLEFDDSMAYKFSGRYGSAQVYNGLSQGQKRKLNFAIAMAFRDFVTAIADFRMNALFLDEVLDISTDEEAFVGMVELLKEKVPEVGGIYLMTHRGELVSDVFDQMIEVEHDGLYSSLKTKKIIRSSKY